MSSVLTLIHFNDVYNINERNAEPVGGVARFATAIRSFADRNPMVLFSGDVLSPSAISSYTKGSQFVDVLNLLNIQCAVYGNHEFDNGVDNLVTLKKQMNFPWLLSNFYDKNTKRPMGEGEITRIIEWEGRKIGIIGLVAEYFPSLISAIHPESTEYRDYVTEGKKLAVELKEKGAEYIIALTHMLWESDRILANEVPEINIILGGHDHGYITEQINDTHVIKSGTDFQHFSVVTLTFDDEKKVKVEVEKKIVDSSFPEADDMKKIVQENFKAIGAQGDVILGQIESDLDGIHVRSQETTLGNFLCGIVLNSYNCEVALLNAGCMRSNRIHPAGDFKVKDLKDIFSIDDTITRLSITGEQFKEVLENGVSKYPLPDGRFPQLGGATFQFDSNKPPGERVVEVKIQNKPLDLAKEYSICTAGFIGQGKDGYDVFKKSKILMEHGASLCNLVQNHFDSIKIVRGEIKSMSHHWQSVMSIFKRKSLVEKFKKDHVKHDYDSCDGNSMVDGNSIVDGNAMIDGSSVIDGNSEAEEDLAEYLHAIEIEEAKNSLRPMVDHRISEMSVSTKLDELATIDGRME